MKIPVKNRSFFFRFENFTLKNPRNPAKPLNVNFRSKSLLNSLPHPNRPANSSESYTPAGRSTDPPPLQIPICRTVVRSAEC